MGVGGGGGGGGGGSTEIYGHIYTTINIGGLEYIKQPLFYIPNDTKYNYRYGVLKNIYYNGYDVDTIESNLQGNQDGWRVPTTSDISLLYLYLSGNNIPTWNVNEWGNPRGYITDTNQVITDDYFLWSHIQNNQYAQLRCDNNNNYSLNTNTAPYYGSKYLLLLCRDA